MRKVGIVARIALIVTAALFVSQIVVMVFFIRQNDRSPTPPYAIADRIVAVIRLIDSTPADIRDEVLLVSNVSGFEVAVHPQLPPGFEDDFGTSRIRVVTQRLLDDHAPGRVIRAGHFSTDHDRGNAYRIVFAIGLASGETAVFTVSDETTLRVWNMPIGFLAGFFGIAVAIIAIFAVARETRPLSRLARHIDELGNRIEPVAVKEEGARELRTLIRAINQMQERILGLVNNRTLFLGAISHDLKTYLTRFRLRLEMMPASSHREKAIADIDAMQTLLDDALVFASDSAPNSDAETVDLNDSVRRCAADADPSARLIEVVTAPGPLHVGLGAMALSRVIDNLISNALRYGEHARISTEMRGAKACFIVEDDGPGIADGDLPFVLEPFFRAEPSRNRAHGGTGLGLAIVKQILDANGGTIAFENKPAGTGLVVTVCLPRAR